MPDGTREQLFLVHLDIDGVDLGIWDKWTGGGKDANSTKYRSGGQPLEESLGGPVTMPDISIERNYRLSRDYPILGYLLNKPGIGWATATKTPLNRDYTAFGKPIVAAGIVKTVTDPPADSNSANPALVVVTFEVNYYVQS